MIEKIAIVGLGNIGIRHLNIVRALLPDSKIIIVRSGKSKKLEEEKYADRVFFSLKDAIDYGISAAILASPANYHIEQAIDLMKNDIHVFIEKPLSNCLKKTKKLLDIQSQSNSIGLLGYCLRYSQSGIKFKNNLKQNKMGKLLHVHVDCGSYLPFWRKGKDYKKTVSAQFKLGGGVLLELSHELDYINWFFGKMKNVYAKLQNSGTLDIDVEDSADLIFESEKGYVVSVHLDFNSQNNRRSCKTIWSKGSLTWDVNGNKVIWKLINGEVKEEIFENDKNLLYIEQMKHFFDCIYNKKRPLVSFCDGVNVLNMVESAKKSNEFGKKMTLA